VVNGWSNRTRTTLYREKTPSLVPGHGRWHCCMVVSTSVEGH